MKSLQWVIIIVLVIIVYNQFDEIKQNLIELFDMSPIVIEDKVIEVIEPEPEKMQNCENESHNIEKGPSGVNVTDESFDTFVKKDIPKIPYATHMDLIAPPKEAIKILCPECDNKWE